MPPSVSSSRSLAEEPLHAQEHSSSTTTTAAALPPRYPPPSPSLAESIRSLRETTRPKDGPRREKPIPSPLSPQTSHFYHGLAGDHAAPSPSPASSRSPFFFTSPYPEGPRSPREKLDALLAEEDSRASATTPTQAQPSPPTPPATASRGVPAASKPPSYAPLRNVSAPVLSAGGISPPLSPTVMPPPSRPSRPETRPMAQRNPSIDSAVSSLSSNTSQSHRTNPAQAYKPSQDVSTMNPPDMASLVAAAGSVEAALLALWKEKQTATGHNTQLWRLVEKQRAMIMGLNKDLERALKDKERYRKKLKDYTSQVPPLPSAHQRSDTFDSVVERGQTPSPAPSERQDDLAKPSTTARPSEHKTSPLTQGTTAAQLFPDAQLAQSPSHSSETHTASNVSSAVNSPTDYSVKPLNLNANVRGLGLNAVVDENAPTVEVHAEPIASKEALRKQSEAAFASSQVMGPQLSVTQATPVIGSNGFDAPLEKPSHPLRKAPPAPLNLTKSSKPSAHLRQVAKAGDQSDSDYDDTLEVDEIPIVVDRGRRKTREEDDRVREAMMTTDDTRSKSKKKKSESKSSKTAGSDAPGLEQNKSPAGSLSPRMFSPTHPGLPLSPRHPPTNSLNALLSPTNSESSMIAQRSVGSPPLMSPGLPSSPRPGDRPLGSPLPRNPRQNLASPPMSPRTAPVPIPQPGVRTTRQPVPLPPNTPQSYTSPPVARPEAPAQVKQPSDSSDLLRPSNAQPSPDSDAGGQGHNDPTSSEHVYRGLVSDQYPGLLLPPNALPSIDVRVFSSRLQPSRLSFMAPKPQEEDPVFILAIYARSDGKQLWRLEKTIMALPALDAQIKSLCDFSSKLPDRALFSGHAPAKMDARRAALNHYFNALLETNMSEKAALVVCEFFSTDVIGVPNEEIPVHTPTAAPKSTVPKLRQKKEGYLTKRGKNFGGWKARFFVLDGPEFRYYESIGGAHLGTIKLHNAQIGKQSQQQANQSPQRRDESEDNQYRHAFLILEPKRKDSTSLVRHVLCAESDEERDAWVDALLQHVDWQEEPSPTEAQAVPNRSTGPPKGSTQEAPRTKRRDSPEIENRDGLRGLSYENTVAAQAPMRGPTHREAKESYTHSPKSSSFPNDGHQPTISGPTNGAPIQNLEAWGNRMLAPTTVKDKKRSIFGFRSRGSSDLAPGQGVAQLQQQGPDRIVQNRNIFGIPLQEAVEYSQPIGVHAQLPSVVYRSLEYLRAKNASSEEGIFRLSGSNIVIKALRDRFNNEGDVKLVDGQYYDVHAVASLLKLYLRELPASILTRELHLDFLKSLDLDERSKKVHAINVLVHKLPTVNFQLIQAVSAFLIEIIDNASMNKMTVRNVGIVFAPTLNIPAPLISLFLTDYPDIFGSALDEASSPIREIQISTPPLGDDAIRSPRHQMFSDLPTPAYNETTFKSFQAPSNFPMPGGQQQLQLPQQSQQPQSQSQQQRQYAGYDTGFIPLHPSYDAPAYEPQYQNNEGFGSLNGALQQPGTAREQKQRRRESGMLLMNMGMGGQRKGSNPRVRDAPKDVRIVREETAFE
ncbi:hypothetical protein P154DRAFT_578307 [Amniculicola lignicola CBS 123094]|uniref:RhoGAP-domain-containing protein n=1 Tax=Amniculicola lignicola CBS 123094 TaxID=1392246 RepID=A0A6A5W7W1_9PLEO|nr:hypothetical protein P154DRAFT_578307 [Amniculicola lignicola CBS 123094]